MHTATTVNKSQISMPGRPLSLMAAIGVLGVSLYVSHLGLVRVFHAGELAGVLTALLIFLSILQWVSMGRARSLRAAGDTTRAGMVALQALFLGAVEATLNWNGVMQLAAAGGADWSSLGMQILVAVFAIGGAYLNLTVKFASCEPIEGGMSIELEHEPPPARRFDAGNVHDLEAMRARIENDRPHELAGVRSIMKEVAQRRAAEWANMQARKDPATGKWRKQPKRRKAA